MPWVSVPRRKPGVGRPVIQSATDPPTLKPITVPITSTGTIHGQPGHCALACGEPAVACRCVQRAASTRPLSMLNQHATAMHTECTTVDSRG